MAARAGGWAARARNAVELAPRKSRHASKAERTILGFMEMTCWSRTFHLRGESMFGLSALFASVVQLRFLSSYLRMGIAFYLGRAASASFSNRAWRSPAISSL